MSSFQSSLTTLQDFFLSTDSGSILDCRDPDVLRDIRRKVNAALADLLVWERPGLECFKSISWPYDELAKRCSYFESCAKSSADGFKKKQAVLFLSLLPFPGQWRWLLHSERLYRGDAELKAFLDDEMRKILKKIESKPQNTYKLRHFCQIIKRPVSQREKGVLRIFSLPYLFVMYPQLLRQLSQKYVLYAEPPMGIVFRHAWWRYFTRLEAPCIIGVGSQEDIRFLESQAGVVAVPLAHGDYMEDADCRDIGRNSCQQHYDIVFNATYDDMPRKRHGLMLQLMQHPLLLDRTALFLGRGQKCNVDELRHNVAALGLDTRVTVLANLRRPDVPAQLCQCKLGVHLSLYENACRGIYEFMRSDLPCIIPSSMGGMNLALFNDQTGMAVAEKYLPEAIAFALENRARFSPREWFLNHSGSTNSTRKLNAILKEYFAIWGYEWRQDIVPLGSSGASRYVKPSHYRQFHPEFEWLLKLFSSVKNDKLKFSIE